jgi:hypothetical protein
MPHAFGAGGESLQFALTLSARRIGDVEQSSQVPLEQQVSRDATRELVNFDLERAHLRFRNYQDANGWRCSKVNKRGRHAGASRERRPLARRNLAATREVTGGAEAVGAGREWFRSRWPRA